MAFLTIDGTAYDVDTGGATQGENVWRGAVRASFNNTLRSDRHARRRVWDFDLTPLPEIDALTLMATCDVGGFTPVAGDAIGGAITADVRVTAARYVADGMGFKRALHLTIEEQLPGNIPLAPGVTPIGSIVIAPSTTTLTVPAPAESLVIAPPTFTLTIP